MMASRSRQVNWPRRRLGFLCFSGGLSQKYLESVMAHWRALGSDGWENVKVTKPPGPLSLASSDSFHSLTFSRTVTAGVWGGQLSEPLSVSTVS